MQHRNQSRILSLPHAEPGTHILLDSRCFVAPPLAIFKQPSIFKMGRHDARGHARDHRYNIKANGGLAFFGFTGHANDLRPLEPRARAHGAPELVHRVQTAVAGREIRIGLINLSGHARLPVGSGTLSHLLLRRLGLEHGAAGHHNGTAGQDQSLSRQSGQAACARGTTNMNGHIANFLLTDHIAGWEEAEPPVDVGAAAGTDAGAAKPVAGALNLPGVVKGVVPLDSTMRDSPFMRSRSSALTSRIS